MYAARVRLVTLVTALALGGLLAGCGDDPAGPAADQTSASTGSSMSAEPPSPTSDVQAAALERARGAELHGADLPDGWSDVPVQERFTNPPGVPSYCGVVVEPEPLHHAAIELYEERSTGPFVLQYTFVTDEAVAQDVFTRVDAAAGSCEEPGFEISQVEDLPALADGVVGLDYRSDQGAASRAVVMRAGDTLVVLVGYGDTGVPRQALNDIAGRVAARL